MRSPVERLLAPRKRSSGLRPDRCDCPQQGKGAALVLPRCDTPAMNLHLAEVAQAVAPGAHGVLLMDRAGWHRAKDLVVPNNLRVYPGSFCYVRELSEHTANGSQVQEGESFAAEALRVFGQPTAVVQQSYGAFDNPALRQAREALGLIGPLDDLPPDAAADAAQTRLELRPLIAAVGVKLEQKRVQPEEGGHDHHATVTVLHVGCLHAGVHQQTLGVDQDMALLPPDLLARVVARRVD